MNDAHRNRDAGDGQFVTDEEAEANPGTTVRESIPRGTKGQQAVGIGRVVHYVSYGTPGGEYTKQCRAATITEILGDEVGLAVVNPTGLFFHPVTSPNGPCRYDDSEEPGGGTWHWPERS